MDDDRHDIDTAPSTDGLDDGALIGALRAAVPASPARGVRERHLAAITAVATEQAHRRPVRQVGSRSVGWTRRLRRVAGLTAVKIGLGGAAVALAASGGLAATGNLPGPAQHLVADVVRHVGIHVPDPAGGSTAVDDGDEPPAGDGDRTGRTGHVDTGPVEAEERPGPRRRGRGDRIQPAHRPDPPRSDNRDTRGGAAEQDRHGARDEHTGDRPAGPSGQPRQDRGRASTEGGGSSPRADSPEPSARDRGRSSEGSDRGGQFQPSSDDRDPAGETDERRREDQSADEASIRSPSSSREDEDQPTAETSGGPQHSVVPSSPPPSEHENEPTGQQEEGQSAESVSGETGDSGQPQPPGSGSDGVTDRR